ncbi:MAG: MazG nucleotide pyrophosphohydrolase domain-containing protein, partial [Chloroflexota bacterium]
MPAQLVVLGLGPGDPGLRTVAAEQALVNADRIVLRTRIHPGLSAFDGDPRVSDCDDLYASLPSFDEVYAAIADRVIAIATEALGTVVYAVPGNPWFGERTVPLVLERAEALGLARSVLAGVSFLDIVAASAERDPLAEAWQLLDGAQVAMAAATQPFSGGQVVIDPTRPCLVTQVYSAAVASDVKCELARAYPEEHDIIVINAAGVQDEERVIVCKLYELDRQPVDHLTSVLVPSMDSLSASHSPQTLQRIIARLRAPGGCPWDRRQNHSTLRQAVIEEAYEVVDAIDAEDMENLAEELGDLLLQVALHAQIAEEDGDFLLEDVYGAVSEKLVRRHPHVFGDVSAETPAEVVKT